MAGIFGIIQRQPTEGHQAAFARMVQSACAPVNSAVGQWHDERAGLFVGWVTRTGSYSDCLPIWNEKHDCVLFFSGNHFADKEEITVLKGKNHVIRATNASYLIHLYEEIGDAFIARLNGAFHGFLFDFRQNTGFLFCDRFGLKRLFVRECAEALHFSYDPRILATVAPGPFEVEPTKIAKFLHDGRLSRDESVFRNVDVLAGPAKWTLKPSRDVVRGHYFEPRQWEREVFWGREYFQERLKAALATIFPRYFRTDESLGLEISGGIGSELLTRYVELPRGKVPCIAYSLQGLASSQQERLVQVAGLLGQGVRPLNPGEAFFSDFATYATRAMAAAGGPSDAATGLAQFYSGQTCPIARSLVGTAAFDAILSGIGKVAASPNQIASSLSSKVQHLYAAANAASSARPMSRSFSRYYFGELGAAFGPQFASWDTMVDFRTPYLDLDLIELFYHVPEGEDYGQSALEDAINGGPFPRIEAKPGTPPPAAKAEASSIIRRLFSSAAKREAAVPRTTDRPTSISESHDPGKALAMVMGNELAAKALGEIAFDSTVREKGYLDPRVIERWTTSRPDSTSPVSVAVFRVAMIELFLRSQATR